VADELRGAFAFLDGGEWAAAQQSALAMFGTGHDEFLEGWPKAGTVRHGHAHRRAHVEIPRVRAGQYWPTPAASLPNETEDPAAWLARWLKVFVESDINTGVPLGIAAEAPLVLQLARRRGADDARRALREHAREPNPGLRRTGTLNPAFVESLMGFPAGWTDLR